MLAKTFSATLGEEGVEGTLVTIEAAREKSPPQILITGLPGEIVKESRERIRVALTHLGFDVPSSRILVHLSPAGSRKQGSQFDLPIALSLLAAEGYVPPESLAKTAFMGELSLDGRIRPVPTALSLIDCLEREPSLERVVVSTGNQNEASLVGGKKTVLARNLVEVLDFLNQRLSLPFAQTTPELKETHSAFSKFTLDDVIGQPMAKRALQISIAGRHHCLLTGPPGVGKSMLAECAPTLMPPLSSSERLECLKNYVHHSRDPFWVRPFRSPHHTISGAALLGGGSASVIPGEVSLAHMGVLFLDEFPEFRKDVLEGLREPMQSGVIHLHRIGQSLSLKARFTLIAAMNPCPCGYLWDTRRRCSCPLERVLSYRRRLSGAILDRIDLVVNLSSLEENGRKFTTVSQTEAKASIERALAIQRKRYGEGRQNGDTEIGFKWLHATLGNSEKDWVKQLIESEGLSFRGAGKVLRVARTIADLEVKEEISLCHLREAAAFRCGNLFGARSGK